MIFNYFNNNPHEDPNKRHFVTLVGKTDLADQLTTVGQQICVDIICLRIAENYNSRLGISW